MPNSAFYSPPRRFIQHCVIVKGENLFIDFTLNLNEIRGLNDGLSYKIVVMQYCSFYVHNRIDHGELNQSYNFGYKNN